VGNTTAATGKGFAIGSAALTARALLAAYLDEVRAGLLLLGDKVGKTLFMNIHYSRLSSDVVSVEHASIQDFINYYQISALNPKLLMGILSRRDGDLPVIPALKSKRW
jgi:K(+)-stimulated pyrophosphate-energized sodium pump